MTDLELKQECRKWQELLGLSHWLIDVKTVRGVEIGGKCGQNDYSQADETSLIRIKAPEDYHGYFEYDMEAVLVHELLHLLLDVVIDSRNVSYEQVLSRLSRILVKLKRVKVKNLTTEAGDELQYGQ